jgi:hypothetical protein
VRPSTLRPSGVALCVTVWQTVVGSRPHTIGCVRPQLLTLRVDLVPDTPGVGVFGQPFPSLGGGGGIAVLGEDVQLDQTVPRAEVRGEVATLWRGGRS